MGVGTGRGREDGNGAKVRNYVDPSTQTRPEALSAARYEALIRLAQAISAHRDPKDLFCLLATELRRVVKFDAIGVAQYDEAANKVHWRLAERCSQPSFALPSDVAAEETMTCWVYQHQQPLLIPSVDEETRFPRMMDLLRKHRIQSVCALPLTTVHRRLGTLVIGSEHRDAYSDEEVRFLSLVADIVALAVDDAVNFEASGRAQRELQRESDRLKLLLDMTNTLVSNLELRDLLRAISASLRQGMGCVAVAIFLPDSERRQLRLHALDFPETKGFAKEDSLAPVEGSVVGRVFKTGKPVVGTTADVMSERESSEARAEGIESVCALPLISRNRTLGVLALGRREENSFSPEDIDFLMRAAGQVAIAVENALAYREIADLKDQLAQEKLYLEDEIRTEQGFEEIIGHSAALRAVLRQIETVAPTGSTVLIYGETGTGKELVARAIHNLSPRSTNAFVKLNCAAIPTGLLESELFGHERGAFTGAIAQRIGRFELAHQGTVFLDEIGEIPLELQPKLLRVLQEREFERLGSTRTLRTDARLIAATNRDLAAMVDDQRFRGDLFYRLNVFPVHIPPLRERQEDIPLLVRHFVQYFAQRMKKTIDTIPSETINALSRYHWPGNIRELQNVIERAAILSTGPILKVALTDLKLRAQPANSGKHDTLEEAERKHILAVLHDTNWVLGGSKGAAARLAMKRPTLQFRMRKLGISRPGA
jgi:formate hydrogenlyase transcriptional activator